jgi:hypothetical protein
VPIRIKMPIAVLLTPISASHLLNVSPVNASGNPLENPKNRIDKTLLSA